MATRGSSVKPLVPLYPKPLYVKKNGQVGFRLITDTHIGSAHFDRHLLERELEEASDCGDRILLGGDVMDLILPSDTKRYSPTALDERLQGRNDVVNETVAMAYEIFKPYRYQIDMIGSGNHEAVIERRHSFDVTRDLIEKLNSTSGQKKLDILNGGYSGVLNYVFDPKSFGPAPTDVYIIFYYHGAGSGADVNRIMSSLRSKSWVRADVFWEGHRHGKLQWEDVVLDINKDTGFSEFRPVRYIATGAYVPIFTGQTPTEMKEFGHESEFGKEMGLVPHGLGGARLILDWPQGQFRVRVLQ